MFFNEVPCWVWLTKMCQFQNSEKQMQDRFRCARIQERRSIKAEKGKRRTVMRTSYHRAGITSMKGEWEKDSCRKSLTLQSSSEKVLVRLIGALSKHLPLKEYDIEHRCLGVSTRTVLGHWAGGRPETEWSWSESWDRLPNIGSWRLFANDNYGSRSLTSSKGELKGDQEQGTLPLPSTEVPCNRAIVMLKRFNQWKCLKLFHT